MSFAALGLAVLFAVQLVVALAPSVAVSLAAPALEAGLARLEAPGRPPPLPRASLVVRRPRRRGRRRPGAEPRPRLRGTGAVLAALLVVVAPVSLLPRVHGLLETLVELGR